MIETKHLYITNAIESDIKTIIEWENHKDNKKFVWSGTEKEHRDEIKDKDYLLFIFRRKKDDLNMGFALIKLELKSQTLELRRLVISHKGMGYGKEVLSALFKYAFEELDINRFWLDVYPDNFIGIKLYEKFGMHRDGVLRESYKSEYGYLDQIIFSKLKNEYFKEKNIMSYTKAKSNIKFNT